MKKVAVVLVGHYRSFDDTEASFKHMIENVECDFFFHTWASQDASTTSWHGIRTPHVKLSDDKIQKLKKYDPNIEIDTQVFNEEELQNNVNGKPIKAILYLFDAVKKCLRRITPSKYDYIFVGRYDILYKNICLDTLEVLPGEIKLSYGLMNSYVAGGFLLTDVLYAFNPNDIRIFLEHELTDIMISPGKQIISCEEFNTLFLIKYFERLTKEWAFNEAFEIVRWVP